MATKKKNGNDSQAVQDAFAPEIVGDELDIRKVNILADIEAREPDAKEIWYGHSLLTSTLFPTKPPEEGTDFVAKTNGSLEYLLEAGIDPDTRKRQFPSGKYPRLIMAWMAKQIRAAGDRKTATVDPQTRTITIPSIHQFCGELGLKQGGTTAQSVQEQLRLLLMARISVRQTTGFAGRKINDVAFIPIVDAVRTVDDENNVGFSGAAFHLTEEVYNRLARESAPFDTRASSYLLSGRSVLPYDVYVWLTGSMRKLTHDLPVSWDWLFDRFGDSFTNTNNFRYTFRNALKKVQKVYSGVNVTVNTKGIILHPSPTAIAPRPHGVSQ